MREYEVMSRQTEPKTCFNAGPAATSDHGLPGKTHKVKSQTHSTLALSSNMRRLQRAVLVLTCLSWLAWASAVVMYIPYILLYSPSVSKNPENPASQQIPGNDYGTGKLSASIFLFALAMDSLLISAVYNPFEISTDLFYPWFLYYGLVIIPGLVATAGIVFVEFDGSIKLIGIGPACLALVYAVLFFFTAKLFRDSTEKRRSIVMTELNRIALEPLQQMTAAANAEAPPRQKLSVSFRL